VFAAGRRVRLGDSSPGGRLRLDACARYLQDVANDDSRDAGIPNPTAWVARRTVVRVDQFPQYLDQLTMQTWCSALGPRWAERRYSITADDRPTQTFIEAATLWVHVDMDTMKPIEVPVGFAEQFGVAAAGRTISARLHLPIRPTEERAERAVESTWPLRFVDFDVLGHVNNSVYWAIVEEQLARLRHLRAPLTVTLDHRDAIDPGDMVRIVVADDDLGFHLWVTTDAGRVAAVVSTTTG
jgi:acyl-ACP thioesterase